MSNLLKEINQIRNLMNLPLLVENQSTYSELLLENIEEKRCWLYKMIESQAFFDDKKIPDPFNGAGDVQEFLIQIGYNIKKDWVFGDETAKALSIWKFGGQLTKEKKLDTVNGLWKYMHDNTDYDVGDVPGYGPKMAYGVGSLIFKTCSKLSKTCKVSDDYIAKVEGNKSNLGLKSVFNVNFKDAIKYWREYLGNKNVQKKIYDNMTFFDKQQEKYSMIKVISKYHEALNKIEKLGWLDKSEDCKKQGTSMMVVGKDYPIYVNVHYYKLIYNKYEQNSTGLGQDFANDNWQKEIESTFVHEIQHQLWDEVRPLNSIMTIQQAFPNSIDYYSNTNNQGKNLTKTEPVPNDSKIEMEKHGIDIQKLTKKVTDWYEYKNLQKNGYKGGYLCDQNEKLSNLSAWRNSLEQTNELNIGEDIKEHLFFGGLKLFALNGESGNNDLDSIIACYVLGNYKPKPSVFLKELNELAKNEQVNDKKNNKSVEKIDTTQKT